MVAGGEPADSVCSLADVSTSRLRTPYVDDNDRGVKTLTRLFAFLCRTSGWRACQLRGPSALSWARRRAWGFGRSVQPWLGTRGLPFVALGPSENHDILLVLGC